MLDNIQVYYQIIKLYYHKQTEIRNFTAYISQL